MNQLEGLPLPTDVIYRDICKHLWLRDLARAQSVCSSWFHFFLSDYAYAHIKAHLLSELPNLSYVFERFPWKYNNRIPTLKPSQAKPRVLKRGNKKRQIEKGHVVQKKWVMPSGGIWFVLKRWIHYMTSWQGHRDMMLRKRHKDVQQVLVGEWIRSWLLSNVVDEEKRQGILELNIFVELGPHRQWKACTHREYGIVYAEVREWPHICVKYFLKGESLHILSDSIYIPLRCVLYRKTLQKVYMSNHNNFDALTRDLQKIL